MPVMEVTIALFIERALCDISYEVYCWQLVEFLLFVVMTVDMLPSLESSVLHAL